MFFFQGCNLDRRQDPPIATERNFCAGVGVRIFPPVNPFPLEEIYGSMTVKVFPLERIS